MLDGMLKKLGGYLDKFKGSSEFETIANKGDIIFLTDTGVGYAWLASKGAGRLPLTTKFIITSETPLLLLAPMHIMSHSDRDFMSEVYALLGAKTVKFCIAPHYAVSIKDCIRVHKTTS